MMKFIVSRTSAALLNDSIQPCDGAKREVIERDGDARDIVKWTIELATLEELMAFIIKAGDKEYECRAVMWPKGGWGRVPCLEIYDDWRE